MAIQNSLELRSPLEMAKFGKETAIYKLEKKPLTTFFLAIIAGLFIAIGFVFCITVTTGAGSAPYGLVKFIGGVGFSLGLMLIIVCGGDLFTSTILTIIAKVSGRISWRQLAHHWTNVYFGNLVGALLLVVIIWLGGQAMVAKGQWGLNILQMVDGKLHHSFVEGVFLGIMANLMVCLAVWLSYSGKTLLDKTMIVILPIAMFVASGFEHCIANMFLIPLGIIIKNFSSAEFWTMINMTESQFSSLTLGKFIFGNLIPVTIGNIIGGVMVGLTYWFLHLRVVIEPSVLEPIKKVLGELEEVKNSN